MIEKTAIVGMGALGLLYADIITSAKGPDAVTFVMDDERLEKYRNRNFTFNGEKRVFHMEAAENAKPADLVIVAVKYNGLESAIDTMSTSVGEDTVIMSVMNGIDSEKKIAARYGWGHTIDAIAQGMDAMRFGDDLTCTHRGQICIGMEREEQRENLEKVVRFFQEIHMPYTEESDILHRMWAKFMMNVGVNQACAAFETDYAGTLEEGSDANRIMLAAMREVIALANSEGIGLTEKDLDEYVALERTLDPKGMPSMRQDTFAGRPSELEMFAGTVIRMAEQKGIQVPANRELYQRIEEIERKNGVRER